MSKIFEALSRQQNELPDPLARVLSTGEGLPAPAPRDNTPAAAAPAPLPEPVAREEVRARVLPLGVSASGPLLPFDEKHSHGAEQYRIVRTRIVQHPDRPRVILISSPGPADGKTVTAINLAAALSLKSKARVLLVDGDLRRCSVHTYLGLPATPGLAEVLHGDCSLEDAVIRAEEFPNLCIMPGGKPEINPVELLDSAFWVSTCALLRKQFEHVIIDSPPIAIVADYDVLLQSCDGVVVVVRPDHTRRSLCMKALESIPKAKCLGVLINGASDWFLGKSHGYESGYYYGSR
jgi:capsular exopolysaccharide synthesis family protein